MKANYDFSNGRRGTKRALPPQADLLKQSKVRITIMLDADVIAAFKTEAKKPGALPYQTRINQVLRAHLDGKPSPTDQLLDDDMFIGRLAERIAKLDRERRSPAKRRATR